MKTILFTLTLLVSFVSFSQKFKAETTLNGDGTISKTITVSSEPLSGYLGLKAKVSESDTVYYFFYKDMRYTKINSYQATETFTKEDVIKVLDAIHKVKDKVVDYANYGSISISRYGLGSIQFNGSIGYSFVNITNLDNNFNLFLNK